MSWVFVDGNKFTSGGFRTMTTDGKDMWVSTNTSIKIYSFWGEHTGLVATVTLPFTDIRYMIKVHNKMYVFNNSVNKFACVDIVTKEIVGDVVDIIHTTDCIPAFGNGKLWFTTVVSNNSQKLFFYNLDDNTWSSLVTIPGRHQTTKRKIIWGRAGFIYVLNANESGVSKFNDETAAHIANITTNRTAAADGHITTNDNFEILVSGFNGMVSSVNQTTNTPTNIAGLSSPTDNFVDDGTYLWTINPSASRIEKSITVDNYITMKSIPNVTGESHPAFFGFGFALNNQNVTSVTVKENGTTLVNGVDYTFGIDPAWAEQRVTIIRDAPNVVGDEPLSITVDYSYTPDLKDFEIVGFSDTSFTQVLTTPEYTHSYWDEVSQTVKIKTEPQRIVLLAANAIYFAYNLSDTWNLSDLRAYELAIKGTALVGTGQFAYHGETT